LLQRHMFCQRYLLGRLTPHAEEQRQLVERVLRRTGGTAPTLPARLPALTDDIEHARLAIDGEVESGDDPVAVQQRHHEVTPALGLGHVDLEPEVESP